MNIDISSTLRKTSSRWDILPPWRSNVEWWKMEVDGSESRSSTPRTMIWWMIWDQGRSQEGKQMMLWDGTTTKIRRKTWTNVGSPIMRIKYMIWHDQWYDEWYGSKVGHKRGSEICCVKAIEGRCDLRVGVCEEWSEPVSDMEDTTLTGLGIMWRPRKLEPALLRT